MLFAMHARRIVKQSRVITIKKTSRSFCDQSKKDVLATSLSKTDHKGVILGAALAFIGSVFGSFIQLGVQQQNQNKIEDDIDASKEKDMKIYINQSERSILHARESFVSLQGKHVINEALILARRDAEKALEIMGDMRSTHINLIEKKDGYTKESLLHLIAYIDYHRGTLLLRNLDCNNAQAMLARRLALPPIGSYTDNRTRIKIADVSSQTRDVHKAIRMYEQIAEPLQEDSLVGSFWKVRAMNNHGIVLFSIGVDSEALSLMTNSANSTDVWFLKNIVQNDMSAETISFLNEEIVRLKNAAFHYRYRKDNPSEYLSCLVDLGKVDTVDILHLSKSSDFNPPSSEMVEDMFSNRKSALYAIECLERVRLMMRKRITAKANCVLFRSHPFSNYDEGDPDLFILMEKLMNYDNFTILFKVIDKDWMQQEGRLRILTAIVSGMLLLYEDGRKTHESHDWTKWKSLLDSLTSELLTVSKSYTYPVSNVHEAYAHFVRGRYLLSSGDETNALKELKIIYKWTQIEQRRARKRMKELKAKGITWSRDGVPPRHARLQISNMILMSQLVTDENEYNKLAESLKFALDTFHLDESHTLHVAATHALSLNSPKQFKQNTHYLSTAESGKQLVSSKYDAILAKAQSTKEILDNLSM
jgi:hypothetical protein